MHEFARLRTCTFTYRTGPKPILCSVDFSLNKGDRVLVGGKSGTGKSTLLAVLAGLVPDYIPGKLEGEIKLSYASRALVMQNPEAQIITPSVFEELAFALENKNVPQPIIVEKVAALLERAGLYDKKDKHPLNLSGGECQRVSLLAALAQEAEVLFMDEPLSYLDDVSSLRLITLLENNPVYDTAVIVEHRLELFERYCTRFFRITDGSAEECTFKELVKNHCVFSADWVLNDADKFANKDAPPIQPDATAYISSQPQKDILPVLSVCNMSHTYEKKASSKGKKEFLFNHVSFDVFPGEIVVLMGASGCGKTTLLKKIARMLPAQKGEVILNGNINYSLRYLKETCFFVPQNPEHMFIAESVLAELAVNRDSALQFLAQFGLAGMEHRHPFTLSEGEKRRLNLCAAFALQKKLLLFDEPTYGLDYESIKTLISCFAMLKKQKTAMLVVTHDKSLAQAIGNRVFKFEQGQLHEVPEGGVSKL